jgi:transcriptional regulator with XRE-family HTH domain
VADPLQEAGQLLRRAREQRGLGLRQLAQDTRISTAVIEALERGWRDRLPEPTYLRAMLPLLERHLGLATGSLDAALPPRRSEARGSGREPLLRRFTPGSIDVFTTWQGTVLYALVTLGLIQLLNLQMFRIASRGLLSTRPLSALDRTAAPVTATQAAVLEAYPDLRPLSKAAAGQGLVQLRKSAMGPGPDLSLGELQLRLEEPTRVEVRSPRASAVSLEAVQGQLSLPVLPPFRLELNPPAAAEAVRWRGVPLSPTAGSPGAYVYPPPATPPAATAVTAGTAEAPRR